MLSIAADGSGFATDGEVETGAGEGGCAGENILAVANLLPERVGIVALVFIVPDLLQLLGMGDGEELEHHGIDETEDRGVGSDA